MISSIGKNERDPAPMPHPFREEYLRVNGISEYLLHYPAAPEAPLILHIHGGPGVPASFFAYVAESFPRPYNIVYYDQRGAGKTLRKNPFAKVTMEILQRDLLETVLYLKEVYHKEKICILGHSWGSVLGSAFALDHPEHVLGYIGCGQMYCFRENEKRAYSFLQDAVAAAGDKNAAKKLRKIGAYPNAKCSFKALGDVSRVRTLQGKFGSARTFDAAARRIFYHSPVIGATDSPFFLWGALRSTALMREFWNYDLRDRGYAYQIPVYYVMGANDRTTPSELAREYFDKIAAPAKRWYSVPDAAHFAMLDNTLAWQYILREIICDLRATAKR